jgi:hypothetical protein
MYEYKFVKIELEGLVTRKPEEDYHRVVEKYTEEGWKLIQIFSPSISVGGGGIPNYFELIFERESK